METQNHSEESFTTNQQKSSNTPQQNSSQTSNNNAQSIENVEVVEQKSTVVTENHIQNSQDPSNEKPTKEDSTVQNGFNYVSCDPAPMVEIKLFCGRVPKTMTEEEISNLFQEHGNVKEVIIIRDKESNNHKSSAFVRMASIAHADAAIQSLNGHKVLDPAMGPLQVKYANGEAAKHNLLDTTATEPGSHQAKTFVGSLPKAVTEEMIRDLFSPYGVVDEVFIMTDKATGTGKGCAFVKFAYKEQALYAMKCLDGKKTMEGCSRPIEVRFAEAKSQKPATAPAFNQYPVPHMANQFANIPAQQLPIIHPSAPIPPAPTFQRSIGPWKEYITLDGRSYYHNEQTLTTTWDKPHEFDQFMNNGTFGPKGANIFIFYVPNEWTQNDLLNSFGHFGSILSARIATDKQSGRNRGFAFVSYDSAQAAAAAVHHMNGYATMTKRLKVTIKKGEESYVQPILDQLAGTSVGGGGVEQMRNQSIFPMGGQSTHFPGKYPISLIE